MKTILHLFMLMLSLTATTSYAGSFTSVSTGDWNTPATWSYTGDADGVPDADDNVTILSGHMITLSTATSKSCQNLTVHDTIYINNTISLSVYGDYTINGAERGMGTITFMQGIGTYINGGGDFGNMIKYVFADNSERSILAGTTIKKNFDLTIGNTTLTNYGDVTLKDVIASPGALFVNATGAVLTLLQPNFMAGASFDADALNNTVIMRTGGNLPLTVGSVYSNLVIVDNVAPIIMTSAVTVEEDLMFIGTGSMSQNENDLTVSGNFFQYDSGELIHVDKEYLILDGNLTAQTISTTNLNLHQLNIKNANGVEHTSGNITLSSVLTLESGNFTINPSASFTMLSTATQTARIDEVTSGSVIIGNMTIQRYITGQTEGRDTSWIDLSSPVTSGTFADWETELYLNYTAGVTSNAHAFVETTDGWDDVTSSTRQLIPGEGYEIFLTDNSSMQNWSGTTLSTTGVPNVGDQDLSTRLSYTPGNSNFNLVGNPFQSSISWSTVLTASSDIASTFWYYDHTAGTYVVGGSFDEIPAGQGFWLLSTGPAPQLIIPEAAKTPSPNSTIKSMGQSLPFMSLTLTNTNNGFNQKVFVGASGNATAGFEASADHPFHKSPNRQAPVMYATTTDGKKVVINAFASETNEIIIPLTLEATVSGNYKLSAAQLEYVESFACVTLTDRYNGKTYDLRAQSEIEVQLQANITYAGRFELRLSNAGCQEEQTTASAPVEIVHKGTFAQVTFHYNETKPVSVHVTNLMGQTLIPQTHVMAGENTTTLPLPADFHGMYMVAVVNGNEITTGKLIKE